MKGCATMKKNTATSYAMLISSMLIFGTVGLFRRSIPLSSGMIACARGLMGAAVLFLFTRFSGRTCHRGIGRRNLLLLAVTGGVMGINWLLLFEAYNYTTVAAATLCYYMEPTIVILLSPLVMHEPLSVKKAFCAVVSIIGMVFVSGIPDSQSLTAHSLKGIFFGLSAAVCYSIVVIMNKKIQVDGIYEKTILQLFFAAAAIIPYLFLTEKPWTFSLDTHSAAMLLILGIIHTGFAYALYFGSIPRLKAQSVAVLSYIDPVSALFLSVLLLGERLTPYGMIGAVLIIGSALVSELRLSR